MFHDTCDEDVFAEHRIDEQLAKAMDRKVWLPSGGSLVIDRTEAMTVVDVNTGKFTGSGGNLEETVTRNNLEAAEEIVRALPRIVGNGAGAPDGSRVRFRVVGEDDADLPLATDVVVDGRARLADVDDAARKAHAKAQGEEA